MEVTKNCKQCGDLFTYEEKAGYPRTYCPPCGEARKAQYQAKSAPVSVPQVPVAGLSMSGRDQSIVAQVCVKGAVELAKGVMNATWTNDTMGEFLCMAVAEIAGAYKHALIQLE